MSDKTLTPAETEELLNLAEKEYHRDNPSHSSITMYQTMLLYISDLETENEHDVANKQSIAGLIMRRMEETRKKKEESINRIMNLIDDMENNCYGPI